MLHAAPAPPPLGSMSPGGYAQQQPHLQPHYMNAQHDEHEQQPQQQQQEEPVAAAPTNPTALQRANSRTDAIARLRRAASQREMRRTPTPTAPREGSPEEERMLGGSSGEDHESSAGQIRANALGLLARRAQAAPPAAEAQPASLGIALHDDPQQPQQQQQATLQLPPGSPQTLLAPPSPLGLGSGSHSPSPTPSLTRSRSQNKSPLPSLSQLRARILLERGEGGLSRANTTGGLAGGLNAGSGPGAAPGSASAAARAYALEKLLGASAREGAVSPASDGDDEAPAPIGLHARRTSRSSRAAGFYGQAAGNTAIDEPAAFVDRPMLRRSRTIGGLSAMAEAQRKAAFVQGSTLELPPPGSQRRSSRRFAQGAGMRSSSPPASLRSVPAPISPPAPVIAEEEPSAAATGDAAQPAPSAASDLARKPSQRELARTEMMRKLSGRRKPPPSLAARAMPAPLALDASTPASPALPTSMSEDPSSSGTTAQYLLAPASSSQGTTLVAVTAPTLALTPDTGRSFYSNFAPSPSLAVPGTPARTYDAALLPGATSARHSLTSTGLSPRHRARALSSSAGSDGYAPSGVSTSAASVARFAAERDRASAADWAERSDAFELEQALLRSGLRGNASNVALGEESVMGASRRETKAFSEEEEEEREVREMDAALEVERQRLDPDRQASRGEDEDDDEDDDDRSEITRDDTPELGRILAEWTSEDGGATSSTTSSPLVRAASFNDTDGGAGTPTSPLSPLERPVFLNRTHASTASIPLALSASHGDDDEYEEGMPQGWTSRQDGEWPVSVSSQVSTARASPSPALSGDGDDEEEDDEEGVIKIPIRALEVSPPRSTSITPPASPGEKPVLSRLDVPGAASRPRGAAALDALLSPSLLAEYGHPLDYTSAATSPTTSIAVTAPGGTAPPKMPARSSSLRGGARGSMASGFSGVSGASTVGEMYGHASKHSGDTFGASSSEARGEAAHPASPVRELKSVDEIRRASIELPQAPVLAAQHVRHGSRGGHERKISTVSTGERAGVPPPLSYASTRSGFSSASREDRAGPLISAPPPTRPGHKAKTPSTSSLVLTAPPQPARPNNAQAGFHPPAASSSELAAMYANDKLTPFPGLFQAPESNTSSVVITNGPSAAAKNEPFVPHAMKVHPPLNPAASEGAGKSVSRSASSRTMAQLDRKEAALGKALNAAQAGTGDGAPPKLTRETSKARMMGPSFFSSLRRKASNLGRSPDPEGAKEKDKDKTMASERSPKRGGIFDGPVAMLHRRTPSRDPVGTNGAGAGSLSANVSLNGHARTASATSSRYAQDDSPEQVIGRSSQNADELLQRNLSLTSLTSSGRAAGAPFNADGDVSISSTLDAAHSNGTMDAGLGASPPRDARAEASAATSSLAPATAAMLHRYSHILTSPVEATQLAPAVPLTPAQFERPPRQLIHAAPVLQVVTNSTVKDRFLLLFSDILVIAKPVAPPLSQDGLQPPQTPTSRLPSLKWSFSVKNIVELHYAKLSVPSEKRTAPRAHPLMASFVRRFRTNPTEALEGIIAQSGLTPDAPTIAKLLHQTPELDRDGLTAYLCDFEVDGRMDVMRAYVETQRLAGVSIESALRTLLLGLRFPTDAEAFEALLVTFARRWTLANRGLIKDAFSAELATNLVLAIMALNDALHSPTPEELEDVQAGKLNLPVTPGLFSDPMPSLSKSAFLAAFRSHDADMVLSDRTLLRIYSSVRADPISQAMSAEEEGPRYAIRLEPGSGLPSKLVYGVPSEPVRISIPTPDAEFAIRLYGQDLTFEPSVLTFEKARQCSFTITSKSLGPKHAVFVRAGRTARHYVDVLPLGDERDGAATLPITATINVERAFMRNCFTITVPGAVHASMNGNNAAAAAAAKRKYMFSVDDESTRQFWVRAIGERIDASMTARKELSARLAVEREESSRPARPGAASAVAGPASTRRAAETLALHVLRETLIANDEQPIAGTSPSALQRSASSAVPVNRGASSTGPPVSGRTNLLARAPSDSRVGSSRATGSGASAQASDLGRNQSISRHYYAGAGRTERELLLNSPPPPPLPAAFARPAQLETHHELQDLQPEAPLSPGSGGNIHGEDLVTTCAQNSLLPLVLGATATAARADEQLQQQQQQQQQY